MIIQTQSLTARALDWAVGVAVGKEVGNVTNGMQLTASVDSMPWVHEPWNPTANWGQLGPLIETCKVGLVNATTKQPWLALCENAKWCEGDTPQIAACRAIVYSKLGDQVDVPEVLC